MSGSWPIPKLIGLFFAAVWGVIGSLALPAPGSAIAASFSILVSLGLALWTSRATPAGNGLFGRNAYRLAVVAEIFAIATDLMVLGKVALLSYAMSSIGVIVGLHFIGLWRATLDRRYIWIAFSMCTISFSSMLLPADVGAYHARDLAAGVGNALVLWAGAAL